MSSCHPCQFPTKLINGWVSVHGNRFLTIICFFPTFFDWFLLMIYRRKTLRWHHNFAFLSIIKVLCCHGSVQHRRQNVVRTVTFSSHVALFFLTIFWSHLWSITEQTDDNIESTCWAERKFGLWTLLNYLFHPSRHMSVEYEQ